MRFDPTDRPLIVQFGGATLEELLPASLIAQEYDIDAIDINMVLIALFSDLSLLLHDPRPLTFHLVLRL